METKFVLFDYAQLCLFSEQKQTFSNSSCKQNTVYKFDSICFYVFNLSVQVNWNTTKWFLDSLVIKVYPQSMSSKLWQSTFCWLKSMANNKPS